jgi:hypothetical protein
MSLLAIPIANSRHFKACFQKKRIRVDINAPATLTPNERQFLFSGAQGLPRVHFNLKRIEMAALSEIEHFGLRAL